MHNPRPGSAPVVASGLLSAALFVAMTTHAAALHPSIVALQFTYDRASFGAILQQWQAAGAARFLEHFRIDFPFLAAYGTFGYLLGSCVRMATAADAAGRRFLVWGLPWAALADALENLLHLALVRDFATAPDWLFAAAGLIATTKWLLIASYVAAILVHLRARRA